MSQNVIYCFSGSGNCLDIAKNIARVLGDTDIVMMRRAPAIRDVRFCERVGFVFPCYAGGLPGDVEEFVRTLSVKPNPYTFGVVCYAGYPGVGLAKLHGIVPLDYWAGISHQSACIWLMPHTLMIPPLTPEKAQKRSEELAAQIGADVKAFVKRTRRPPPRCRTGSRPPSGRSSRRRRPRPSPSRAAASAAASAPGSVRRGISAWSARARPSAPTASSVSVACNSARRRPSISAAGPSRASAGTTRTSRPRSSTKRSSTSTERPALLTPRSDNKKQSPARRAGD